jgi:signal transduction histidine kinase
MPAFARRILFWKYALWFSGLVIALLTLSGGLAGYFAYRQSMEALEHLQREKVRFVAAGIDDFIGGVEDGLRLSATKFAAARPVDMDDLGIELISLLRHQPAITEVRWVDGEGEELLSMSRLAPDQSGLRRTWIADPRFVATRKQKSYVSSVYFRDNAEPYVSIAVSHAAGGQMIAGEANLKFVSDFISTIPISPSDVVYIVDAAGHLISHADPRLALRRSDLSALPQVRNAIAQGTANAIVTERARNTGGVAVVATATTIGRLGWTVLAEQEEAEAFRPVYAAIARSVILVGLGVLAAILASLALAKRMAEPVQRIAAGARAIGAGKLDMRIEAKTGDELESLADAFNDMTAQLHSTHALQEARISERTQALALANQAKSRFLAAASHDLRQPLHALSLFVAQLRGASAAEAPALIEKVEASVDTLARLLQALLDLSKLDMGGVHAELADIPLQDLLARLTSHLAPIAEAKGLALTMVPTSLWGRTDPLLLERILTNVVANAIRYTHEGRVLLGCRRHGQHVDILVVDTGVGVAASNVPNLFDEFYRVDPADSPSKNFGLGLAIVKRLAALLGHAIDLKSVVGRGTTLRVRLPRAHPQANSSVKADAPRQDLHGSKVMLVDDDSVVREGVEGLLRQWGCEVTAVGGLSDVRKQMPSTKVDVVLCDLKLSDENGLDVVRELRARYGEDLPCAFITGESSTDALAEVRKRGFPIAHKPMAPAKLRALVEHLASTRR